jgi:hypothetical protein
MEGDRRPGMAEGHAGMELCRDAEAGRGMAAGRAAASCIAARNFALACGAISAQIGQMLVVARRIPGPRRRVVGR